MNFSVKIKTVFFIVGLLGIVACGAQEKKETTLEYMPDMADAPSVKAQEEPMRVPPSGTFPMGYKPYPYAVNEGDRAGAELSNPLPLTRDVLMNGQKVYNTFCVVCHGPAGKGDGSVVGLNRFPMPPSLHSDKVTKQWSDGRIYHVITKGQNLMPSYATQIFSEERWAVIYYLRALQRAVNPSQADVDAYIQSLGTK